MMNGISKWKIVLYLAAIFAAGGVSGWVVAAKTTKERIFSPPAPKEISSHFCDRLFSRMNLTTEQSAKIKEISDRYAKEVDAVRDEQWRRIRTSANNRNAQINAILTPEQRVQFEEIERERRESNRKRDHDRKDKSREKADDRQPEKTSTNGSGKPPC
jgi:Spy/CpxP family protein refolding chaperone